ncbi:hypothetical protein [Motiliproteus sediminis]|uniref:hypothetical protein n=1 Tax=Motiliproteus sediminis TaxID=1468178 RepID=UPI001AEF8FD0|nr:hypothetical protein [Motiliproteus sediminis]
MKTYLIALTAALSFTAEAASLTVKTTDAQVAEGATFAFGCFRGADLHLRFEKVPHEHQIPERAELEVSAGNQSQLLPVTLRAFKLGPVQDVGVTLSATPVLDLIRTSQDGVSVRLPGLAVPVSAHFDVDATARLRTAAQRCK